MSQIVTTQFLLPTSVISNGQSTGNAWTDPNNILLVDGDVAQSNPNNAASDIQVGNYLVNLDQDAVIVGIEMELIAYRGAQTSPVVTLNIDAIDNSSGSDVAYPYIDPVTTLTQSLATYILGSPNYLFNTVWTPDMINNLKLRLVANGDIYVDSILVKVYSYIPDPATPPDIEPGVCISCESPIQIQSMQLARPFLIGQTKFYLKPGSFSYPDGTPVQPGDVGACGGKIPFVFDEGKKRSEDSPNFEENAMLDTELGTWTVLVGGVIEMDLGVVTQRGLGFHTPGTHVAALMSDHNANTEVVVSNNTPYNLTLVRRCQQDTVFSPPISVEDEGDEVVPALHILNFIGPAVQAEADSIDPHKANVTILTNATNEEPTEESTSTGSTGAGTAGSLSFAHTITDANYLRVGISCDDEVISSVTYNGVAMTLIGTVSNGPADLKVALYGLINPVAGTHNVIITMASPSHITGIATGWLDVDTTSPVDGVSSGAIGTGTAPSDSGTTSTQNSVVQDMVGVVNNPTTFAQGTLWSIRGQVNAAARAGASSSRKVLIPAAITDTYTTSPSAAWAIIIAGIRGIVNPSSSGVQSVTGYYVDNTDPANPIITAPKNNVTNTAPTVNDDDNQGYSIASEWLDTSTSTLYVAEDVTTGAAVWTAVGGGGSGQATIQFKDENNSNLGTPGTVDEFQIAGPSVVATRVGNKVTYTISATGVGGSGQPKHFDFSHLSYERTVNTFSDQEIYLSVLDNAGDNGIQMMIEIPGQDSQLYNFTTDWVDASAIRSVVVKNGFAYVLLEQVGGGVVDRVYRYDVNDFASGGTLMTIAGTAFGILTTDFSMTSDGSNGIYFTAQAGNSNSLNIISKYTLSGTTLTFDSDITCGATSSNFNGGIMVSTTDQHIFGLDTSVGNIFEFNAAGSAVTNMAYSGDLGAFNNLYNWNNIFYGLIFNQTSPIDGMKIGIRIEWDGHEASNNGGGNNNFIAQDIPIRVSGSTTSTSKLTSTLTGDVLFFANIDSGQTSVNIYRLVKDSLTSNYYATHTTTLAVDSNSLRGIAVVGNFLYVGCVIGGNSSIRRYDIADLGNVTTITGVTAGTIDGAMWSDGTDLFCFNGTDTFQRYTISGTSVTDVGGITFTSAGGVLASISDGNFVWTSDSNASSTSYVINKYAITGGAAISTTTILLSAGAYVNNNDSQMFMGASNILGIGWNFESSDASAIIGQLIHLMGITLP